MTSSLPFSTRMKFQLARIAAWCVALAAFASAVHAQGPEQAAVSWAELARDFAEPPAEWKSRPLWFWNGPLDEASTTQLMERSRDSGYHGFGILPTEQMGVTFMGPEFLAHYRHAVETAARLGMKMCLYDEFWFPSGSAGGLLSQRHPEALGKRLDLAESTLDGPGPVALDVPPGQLMAAVAMNTATSERLDLTDQVRDGRLAWTAPAGPWRVMLFVCVPDGARGLVDYLDPQSVQKFVDLTYAQYHRAFPEHFGTTIDSAFYDEPTFHWLQGGRAWTPDFNRRFTLRHGHSPVLLYPALWYDIGSDTAAARNLLFGMRAELFATGFIKTLADWCEAHGIELTGHVDQEEVINPVGLCGDLIKVFQHQPIPGLDQIFAYDRGAPMYKVISSAAVNYGRRRVMSECYGAMELPVANLYREAMDQYAKGVNVMVPHAVWYRTSEITFPPELSWRTEPYASALPAYNDYVGRLQRILQQGRPVVDIAVLYPIAGLQADYHFGPGEPYTGGVIPEWADYMAIGERLSLELRQDFTYVHPETLDARCRIEGDTLRLEHPEIHQTYRILILPGSSAMSASNLAKVRQFFDAGGRVIATTRLPQHAAELGRTEELRAGLRHIFGAQAVEPSATASQRLTVNRNGRGGAAWFVETPDAAALAAVLAEAMAVPDVGWPAPPRVSGGHLTYLHKQIAGREVYFFANSSDTPVSTPVRLRGNLQLERWDPHTGQSTPQPAQRDGRTSTLQLELPPVHSTLIVAREVEDRSNPDP